MIQAYISITNVAVGLPECMAARFSISSTAACLSWMRMMVRPRTVTELMGPYAAKCLSQCFHSPCPLGGMSVMFPSIGHGFGPGGRGNFGRRAMTLRTRSKAKTAVATPKRRFVTTVALVIILVILRKAPKNPKHLPLLKCKGPQRQIYICGWVNIRGVISSALPILGSGTRDPEVIVLGEKDQKDSITSCVFHLRASVDLKHTWALPLHYHIVVALSIRELFLQLCSIAARIAFGPYLNQPWNQYYQTFKCLLPRYQARLGSMPRTYNSSVT